METNNQDVEVFQPINLEEAVINLQIENRIFDERFNSIVGTLAQLTSGVQELQNSVKDLIFSSRRSLVEERKQEDPADQNQNPIPASNLLSSNRVRSVPESGSRFRRFIRERDQLQQSQAQRLLSPIQQLPEEQNLDLGVEDLLNVSFRDNEAAVLSMRSRNVGVRIRDEKPKVTKGEHRNSIIRNLDRLTSGLDDNVRVYKSTPSYEHIKLTSDNITSILEFAVSIEQFQTMHKISVPAAPLVSQDIREYIISQEDNPRLDTAVFYSLDNKTVFSLLQKIKQPKNVIEFRKALDTHLRFSIFKDYRPTLTNFKPLYSSLLVYKKNFQRLYDFLADGIKNVEFIPRVDNKEGGLIKIFIDKIPMGIGKRMFTNLNKEKFSTIDEFIRAFYSQLQLLNEISLEVSKLSTVIYEATSNHQQEKTVSRTLALSDPTHLQLVDQLLDNLESEEPADSLAFIARDTKRPASGQPVDNRNH